MQVTFSIPLHRLTLSGKEAVTTALVECGAGLTRINLDIRITEATRDQRPILNFKMTGDQFSRFLILRHKFGGANMFGEIHAEIAEDPSTSHASDAWRYRVFHSAHGGGKTAAMEAAALAAGYHASVFDALCDNVDLRRRAMHLLLSAVTMLDATEQYSPVRDWAHWSGWRVLAAKLLKEAKAITVLTISDLKASKTDYSAAWTSGDFVQQSQRVGIKGSETVIEKGVIVAEHGVSADVVTRGLKALAEAQQIALKDGAKLIEDEAEARRNWRRTSRFDHEARAHWFRRGRAAMTGMGAWAAQVTKDFLS